MRTERARMAVVAALWAVGPALPALLRGEIPGQPYTDLYPSVWGMDVVADVWPRLPTFTTRIAAPEGMGFYYSSPLHAWLGAPLTWVGGAAMAYTLTLLLARFLTVWCAWMLFRASPARPATHPWHVPLGPWGAICAALVYGASPFFQGYAVEGIVEGTDGWTLALWAWAVLRDRRAIAVVAFAATIVSSWYLGMVACALAALWGLRARWAWGSGAVGLALAAPFLVAFLGAFSGASPLPDTVRAAMGAPWPHWAPGFAAALNPFAISTWLGLSVPVLALLSARRSPVLALLALGCAVLSTGRGPWWELPVLSMVRFPYRWHAGTLLCVAPLVGSSVERFGRGLAFLPWLEGWLFSPIEPILPGAVREVPALYAQVDTSVLLDVPGPVALAPGEINRSRPRARYLLYAQVAHEATSPWAPDFNGVSAAHAAPWLDGFASYDPLLKATPLPLDLDGARRAGVTQVMVHRDELKGRSASFEAALLAAGAQKLSEDGVLALYAF